MAIKVLIPTAFKNTTRGESAIEVSAGTVREMLGLLIEKYPGLRAQMVDNKGELQRHVNIFVNDLDIRFIGGLDSPLSDGDAVQIVPAIAGGLMDFGF